jgi:hypothetical protein
VSEIKTGWGNPSNGVKAAAWKSACVIVAIMADDGGTTHVSEIVLTEH